MEVMFNDLWPYVQRTQPSQSSANHIHEAWQCNRIHDLQFSHKHQSLSNELKELSWKKNEKRVNIWTSVTSRVLGTSDLCVAFHLPPICPLIRDLRAQSSCGSQKGTATVGCQSLMVQPCVYRHQGHQWCMKSITRFHEKHPKWFNLIKQNLTTPKHK